MSWNAIQSASSDIPQRGHTPQETTTPNTADFRNADFRNAHLRAALEANEAATCIQLSVPNNNTPPPYRCARSYTTARNTLRHFATRRNTTATQQGTMMHNALCTSSTPCTALPIVNTRPCTSQHVATRCNTTAKQLATTPKTVCI